MIPRISVLMICYNQEDFIRRALDSLIVQRDFLYEICINDDESSDGTWRILKEYQSNYPDLVKPIRNSPNLGIFQNIEATWKRPSGDLIYRLAGDDECPVGYFLHVVEFIQKHNIDFKNEAVCIYGDYKLVNANGSSIVYKNDAILGNQNPLKLKLRELISNRSACFSKKVLERYLNVSEGRSYAVELTQDAELQMFSDYNYYIPHLGNIYYAQLGVSAHFTNDECIESLQNKYDHFLAFCKTHSIRIDKSDQNYIKFMKCYRKRQFAKALSYYLRSINISLGFKGLQFDRILFVLRNKIKT